MSIILKNSSVADFEMSGYFLTCSRFLVVDTLLWGYTHNPRRSPSPTYILLLIIYIYIYRYIYLYIYRYIYIYTHTHTLTPTRTHTHTAMCRYRHIWGDLQDGLDPSRDQTWSPGDGICPALLFALETSELDYRRKTQAFKVCLCLLYKCMINNTRPV